MEDLSFRLESARQALLTLNEILLEPPGVIVRDAGIQRFEYSFEAVWKLAHAYLQEQDGSICNSPKSCFREAMRVGLLDAEETELCLRMTDDRNRTTHTYQVATAEAVFGRAAGYLAVMQRLADRIAQRLGSA